MDALPNYVYVSLVIVKWTWYMYIHTYLPYMGLYLESEDSLIKTDTELERENYQGKLTT
jgi:hypothetical protein